MITLIPEISCENLWMKAASFSLHRDRGLHPQGDPRGIEARERAYREDLVETKDVLEAQIVESLMQAQYQKTLYDHLEARANLDFVVGKQIADVISTGAAQ